MTRRFWYLAAAIVSLGLSSACALAQTVTPSPAVLTFPASPVGVSGSGVQKLTATFQITNGTGFIPATAVLHYGTSYSAGAISCTGTGNPNETCTLLISFSPSYPGGRRDAVFLMNGTTRLATALLYGVGQSPLGLVQPGVLTQPIKGSTPYLFTSVVDENGTAYVLETGNNAVVSVTSAGVVTALPITGLNSPRTIGVDGAGVLYIAGTTNGGPVTTYDTVRGVQGTFPVPVPADIFDDVAVGNTGSIYEVDGSAGVLYTMSSAGASTHQVTFSPVVAGPASMAVDSSEDIFVGGSTINEITAGGVQTQINANNSQNGLSVDAAGTLYATPYPGFLSVAELPAPYTTPLTAFDSTANPIGASEGPDGTIYIGNYTNLDKVDRSQGAVTFTNSTIGSQTVSIYNGGNQSLTVSNIAITGSTAFTLTAATTNNCTGGITLLPGALCNVVVSYSTTHAGIFSGTLTFTDNSLNSASSTQTVAVSAQFQGIYVTPSPASLNFNTQTVGTTSATQPIVLTNGGDLYNATINPATGTGPFTVALGTCTAPVVPGGTCTLQVSFTPTTTATYTNTAIGMSAFSSGGGPVQSFTFTVSGTGIQYVPYAPPSSGSTSALLFTPATVNLVAGLNGAGSTGNGGLATAAKLNYPVGMAYDSSGNLFFADENNYVVRRIDHVTGDISVFAGTSGTFGFSTGGGVATSAQFGLVSGLILDTSNNVYVADRSNNVVWKITSGGAISIYAGGGSGGLGDGGLATAAKLNNPWALGIDASNNIYIADSYNDLIRVVNQSTNIITTFAGVVADAGGTGNCSPQGLYSTSTPPYTALQAHLCFPEGIAFDSNGNAYIVDTSNNIVRVVTKSTGFITTYAGGGASASTVNGIPATSAAFHLPAGVYVDPANRVYIGDFFNNVIRVVDAAGNINTVFGNGISDMIGSIGLPDIGATSANIGPTDGVYDFVMDPLGNLVVTDSSGSAITSAGATGQYIFPQTQIFTTETTTQANATSPFYPPYLTISNPSGVPLTFAGAPVITGPFAISGGTCNLPGTLAPGSSCTIVISFTPTADQLYTGSIVLASNANSSPSTINLSGTGIGTATIIGTLTASLPAFTSAVGVTSAQQTATLTNTGQGPLNINTAATSFVGSNPSDFALASTDCPATMNAGSSCHFNVTFTPAAATGYSAQLQVVITNYGDLHTNLTGTGTAAAAPAVTITPNPDAFLPSPVGQAETAPTPMSLTNSGTGPLTISSISITGANASSFSQTNLCPVSPATLAAGAACGITVLFTPTAGGALTASVSVASNATGSPALATLTGTGTTPQLTLNPNPLAFSSQQVNTTSAPLGMTISNPGGASLLINSATLGGANPSDFTATQTCPVTLAVGASCTYMFTFTPLAAGARTATLTFTDNASNSPQILTLTGTGTAATAPQATLNPNPVNFPSTNVGASSQTMTMSLGNPGNATLNISSITITGANASSFSQTNNCGTTLQLDSSCIITITFTPTAAGALTANISVADNATGSPQTAVITGTGAAATAPQAVLTPNPLAFPSATIGTPATLPLVLSNPGSAVLNINSITVTGANASNFTFTNGCSASLGIGLNCTLQVTFTPTSAANFTAAISVSDNASGSPHTATLTGTGTGTTTSAFTVNSSTPTASVPPGGVAQYNLTVAPLGGTYNNLVTLSATGLPVGATASFTPSAVTPGSAGAPSVLSIQTPSLLARETRSTPHSPVPLLAVLAGVPLLGLATRRRLRKASRRWMLLAIAALALLPALALTGCNGGYFGPAPQTFTITVVGTSGSLQESTTVSLTVQ